jgi:hypothetical protein
VCAAQESTSVSFDVPVECPRPADTSLNTEHCLHAAKRKDKKSARSRVVYSKESQMIFSKDYVGYLARQTVKHLVAEKMIHTEKPAVVNERVAAAMVDELSLEDRINDEVRVILEAFQDDMRKTGASYPEMFKKVKNELARKYKAVL